MSQGIDIMLSIVVPVYNRAAIVTRTLDSIAAQTYRPLRLIIVDNNSTDNTLEVVTEWKKRNESDRLIIDIVGETTQGSTAARNRGLAEVESEWTMFFDSDDEMRPDHIERVMRCIGEHPDAELIYFDLAILDEDCWLTQKSVNDPLPLRGHILDCMLSTVRYAAKTELLRRVGGWHKDCSTWDDLELGTRLLLERPTLYKLHGDARVIIHLSDNSITGSNYSSRSHQEERALDIIEQSLTDHGETLALKWLASRRAILAAHYRREGNKADSLRLKRATLATAQLIDSIKLHLIYLTVRYFGAGGNLLARNFFKPEQPKTTAKRSLFKK